MKAGYGTGDLDSRRSLCTRAVLATDYGQGTEGSSDGYRQLVPMGLSAGGLSCKGGIVRSCVFVGQENEVLRQHRSLRKKCCAATIVRRGRGFGKYSGAGVCTLQYV